VSDRDWFAQHNIAMKRTSFLHLVQARDAATLLYDAAPLFPTFDPRRTNMEGIAWVGTRGDALMATGAAVIRHCPNGLKRAVEDLSFISDLVTPGEFASLHGDTALLEHVTGRIVVAGAVWRAPEAGKGFLAAFWPILVRASIEDLGADWIVGMIRGGKPKWLKIGAEIEDFRHSWEGMTYRDPDWGGGYQTDDFVLCAMSRREALERVLHQNDPIQPTRTA
jgi:hypothetical protein